MMANAPATMATTATNPPKSFRTAHLIEVDEQPGGKVIRLHGYTATTVETPATEAPRRELVETGTASWDIESDNLIQWFLSTEPPKTAFVLGPGVGISDPARWWASINGDIAVGPGGPRWRAMQYDLRKLHALFGGTNQ